MIHPELAESIAAERFLREVRLTAALHHPNLLPLYDSGVHEGRLYYVMPYVGESLRDRLARETQLPVEEAVAIVRELADALAHAHDHGVVHRDVKPDNVLLGAGHAFLGDLGIARAIVRDGAEPLTESGVAVGTPRYMSPEQVSGERELDGRSDQFSLACMLYEMLAGVAPWEGPTAEVVMRRRLVEDPTPVAKLRPTVPPALGAAVMRALAIVPADRYADMRAFAAALGVEGAQTTGRGYATLERLWGGRRRRWAVVMLAVSLGTATIAMVTGRRAIERALGASPRELDSLNYVVLPVRGARGDEVERALVAGLHHWVEPRVTPLGTERERLGGEAPTTNEALRTARTLGAANALLATLTAGESLSVRVVLLDARSGTARREIVSVVRPNAPDLGTRVGALADSLVAPMGAIADARTGVGTRSLAAWQEYATGLAALRDWDLRRASARFSRAIARDTLYAQPRLWRAQVGAWGAASADQWVVDAEQALASGTLAADDSAQAAALVSLGHARFSDACAAYDRVLGRPGKAFVAQFGLGACRQSDSLVVRDARSPTGYAFRSSGAQAAKAYLAAFRTTPAALSAFPFTQLADLLPVEASKLRWGETADGDAFAAYAAMSGDTLAFVPVPVRDIASPGARTVPATLGTAIRRNRDALRSALDAGARAVPRSARVRQSLALLLEADQAIDGPRGALALVVAARRLPADAETERALRRMHVRLLLKSGEFSRAAQVADSALAAAGSDSLNADEYVGLAALLGRTELLMRLLASRSDADVALFTTRGVRVDLPAPVAAHAVAYRTLASVGACDRLSAMEREARQMLETRVAPSARGAAREVLVDSPAREAAPCTGLGAVTALSAGDDYTARLQQAATRGLPALRLELARVEQGRRFGAPGEVSVDATYHEAWLLATLGDSSGAERRLAASLDALPALGTGMLSDAARAGALVRAMALRARLLATRDPRAAARWARAVLVLRERADGSLATERDALRRLATH